MKLARLILGSILIAAIAAGVTSWILASHHAYSQLRTECANLQRNERFCSRWEMCRGAVRSDSVSPKPRRIR